MKKIRYVITCLIIIIFIVLIIGGFYSLQDKKYIQLNLRTRNNISKNNVTEIIREKKFLVDETAIIIVDMWDSHWCTPIMERWNDLAVKINPVIKKARKKGIQIIHAPSDTMDYYANTTYRQRIINSMYSILPVPKNISAPNLGMGKGPNHGCETEEDHYITWTKENPAIEIKGNDVISDNGEEIYSFLIQEGIKNLIFVGVATNQCVLYRSFGIVQMAKWGFTTILVRDLTDTVYNPSPDNLYYFTQKESINFTVRYIEKYYCPTILSSDIR